MTLAQTEEKAVAKAQAYVEDFKSRLESDRFKICLDSDPDCRIYENRGNNSVRDMQAMSQLEHGFLPFGVHKGLKLTDVPNEYLGYWATKATENLSPVLTMLVSTCLAEAHSRGILDMYLKKKEEKESQEVNSQWIGQVGSRINFTGKVLSVFTKSIGEDSFTITKILCNGGVIVNLGRDLGLKPEQEISFKATVKSHDEYKGKKTTKVNRLTVNS